MNSRFSSHKNNKRR